MGIKKYSSGILVIVLAVLIVIGQLVFNLNISRSSPSDKWSKEVKVGEGISNNGPVIIREDDRIVIAYQSEKGAEISVTDLTGKVLETNIYEIDSDFLKDLVFYKASTGYHLLYVTSDGGNNVMTDIVMDNTLKEIKRESSNGVFTVKQCGNVAVAASSEKLFVIDGESDTIKDFDITNISMLTVSSMGDKTIIGYMGEDKRIYTGIYDGSNIDFKITYEAADIATLTYSNLVMSCDKDKIYILFDEYAKGEKIDTRYVETDSSLENCITGKLAIGGGDVSNIVGQPSEDGGRFYGTTNRGFGTKEIRRTIVEFVVKGGEVKDVVNISRVRGTSIYGYYSDGYIAYLSRGDNGRYNINLASTEEAFKAANDGKRDGEVPEAVLDTLQGIMMSIAYIIIIGIRWLVAVTAIAGVITLFDYKFNDNKKKKVFIIVAAINIVIKSKVIYDIVYVDNIMYMPKLISSPIVGILISVIIGIVVFYNGYIHYRKDTEALFIGKYGMYMLLDALLTCMAFIPFFV